ncbi:beta-1,3-galactosyltransferase 5-like [Lytechinus variegatus]|uniref:beta-1,3-galactosyltransferase 5-like n=1 Tax=Lytechinus variegatus TaxID=7654 RepID=UPI001BB154FA|nr:beta-1,3-galactosyltransferase 5-like [Lytechinus variegatus]
MTVFRRKWRIFSLATLSGLVLILFCILGLVEYQYYICLSQCQEERLREHHHFVADLRKITVSVSSRNSSRISSISKALPSNMSVENTNEISMSNYTKPTTSALVGLYLKEPIEEHLFTYIHNPDGTCFHANGTRMDVYLLFFVPSAPGNFLRRNAIRGSYGKRDTWSIHGGGQVVTVFLLGSPSDAWLQKKIDIESDQHGDIVQESFVDSYRNLTLKTMMGFKWTRNHCRHAHFAMKIDDDTSVVQRRILAILEDAPHSKSLLGCVFEKPPVVRSPRDKFYISKEYYPDDFFPAYSMGAGYILTTDLVDAIFNVSTTIPIFPFEDVFVGMCLRRLSIKPRNVGRFLYRASYTHLLTGDVNEIAAKYAIATNIPPRYMEYFYNRFIVK